MPNLPSVQPPILHRVATALGLATVGMTLYMVIGLTTDPSRAVSLSTALDEALPFWPGAIYLYTWIYTVMLFPLFAVRCGKLWRRVVRAYVIVLVVCLLCHYLYPVTSIDLRPDTSAMDDGNLTQWGVLLTFKYDPPYNLFPSLHMAIALVAAVTSWRARPLYGALASVIAFGVAVSIVTLKQHFVLDGIAGLVLGAGACFVALRGYSIERPVPAERAYTWRGPAAYLLMHCSVYLALIIAWWLTARPRP